MVRLTFNNKLCELILRPACLFLVKRKERTLSATRYGLLLFHFYDFGALNAQSNITNY